MRPDCGQRCYISGQNSLFWSNPINSKELSKCIVLSRKAVVARWSSVLSIVPAMICGNEVCGNDLWQW